jgi:hypothetical protein
VNELLIALCELHSCDQHKTSMSCATSVEVDILYHEVRRPCKKMVYFLFYFLWNSADTVKTRKKERSAIIKAEVEIKKS